MLRRRAFLRSKWNILYELREPSATSPGFLKACRFQKLSSFTPNTTYASHLPSLPQPINPHLSHIHLSHPQQYPPKRPPQPLAAHLTCTNKHTHLAHQLLHLWPPQLGEEDPPQRCRTILRPTVCLSQAAVLHCVLVCALVQAAEGQPVGQVVNEIRDLAGCARGRSPRTQLPHFRPQVGAGDHRLGPAPRACACLLSACTEACGALSSHALLWQIRASRCSVLTEVCGARSLRALL